MALDFCDDFGLLVRREDPHRAVTVRAMKSSKHLAFWLAVCPGTDLGRQEAVRPDRPCYAPRLPGAPDGRAKPPPEPVHPWRLPRVHGSQARAPEAVTSTTHTLARIFCHLLTARQLHEETRVVPAGARYRRESESRLPANARVLSSQLVPGLDGRGAPLSRLLKRPICFVAAPGTHRNDGCGALYLDLFEQPGQRRVFQQPVRTPKTHRVNACVVSRSKKPRAPWGLPTTLVD